MNDQLKKIEKGAKYQKVEHSNYENQYWELFKRIKISTKQLKNYKTTQFNPSRYHNFQLSSKHLDQALYSAFRYF
jgi:hypothetical protein